ncbi:sensor histidine kinase [Salinimicrobium gaetbulicola]|uniref:Sensor histidine kinase n=1 Tax=Salinimicrobium gaetbulicola TaxID=999702 RepID=A0ABW3IIT3_9FLAO
MKFSKTGYFFYFYFQSKIKKIEKQVLKKDLTERKKDTKGLFWVFRKAGQAALVSLLLYELFAFLHTGGLLGVSELSRERFLQLEILTNFLYIFSIFLFFPLISKFAFERIQHNNPFIRGAIELSLVLVANAVLLSLFNLAPLLLLAPDLEPLPGRIRTAYLVSGIFSLFFYFFVEREKSKKHLQEDMLRTARLQKENFQAQLEGLKNQVNPHFLFNSLNVLSSLIHQDKLKAIEFTRRLGEIYRSFMENSQNHLVSLKKELDVTRSYIYLLETRFGSAVQFDIQIDSEKLNLKLPTGCLQMLVENAIKHNGSTKKRPLRIYIYTENDHVAVKNNLQPRLEQFESTHTGLNNIKSRYRYLSEERVIINKTEKEFITKLPLLNTNSHEDLDN